MDVEYDPVKAESNLRKHKVTFEEASSCLLDPNALVQEDPDSKNENRWILIGMSRKARLLTVVYTLRDENRIRLISARRATKKETNYYA